MSRLCCLLLCVAACGCDKEEEEVVEDVRPRVEEDEGPRIEQIDGVDLSRLQAPDRRLWISQVNDLLSPCGDPISVAECASPDNRGRCARCLPAARFLARLASEGADRTEMRELYQARYGTDSALEINIDEAPVLGTPMGAQVTIVEFSDFECPHCRETAPILKRILREHEGKVRLIYKNYPLTGHDHAVVAAVAALAAARQDKFWEMHDLLFENQLALEPSDIEGYAERIGLEMGQFRRDLQDESLLRRVEADKDEGRELGVQGTPAIFINNRQFMESPESLPIYVREELDAQ